MTENTILMILRLAALVLAIMIHEVMHGLVALWCGDPTAKNAKRLSLNPVRHVDPIGTIVLPAILLISHAPFMFGWAKPVPVNLARTRNPRQAFWMTAIAGPLSNLVQALVAVVMLHVIFYFNLQGVVIAYAIIFFSYYIVTNIVLMTFNLIPIPPLDGSKVLASVLPERYIIPYLQIERFGFIILIVLLNIGAFSSLIDGVLKGFLKLVGLS